jgi:hypothetical protein
MADATNRADRARIVVRDDTGKVISSHTVPVVWTETACGNAYRIEFPRPVNVGQGETVTITMLPEENHGESRRP